MGRVVLVAWAILWVAVGVGVWHEVRGLRPLTTTEDTAAHTLDDTAAVLDGLSHIPLVGGSVGHVAADAHQTAASARSSAAAGRRSIDRLAWLLGVLFVGIGVLPPLYLRAGGRLRPAA